MNPPIIFLTIISCLNAQLGADENVSVTARHKIGKIIPADHSRKYPANMKVFVRLGDDALDARRQQDGSYIELEPQ